MNPAVSTVIAPSIILVCAALGAAMLPKASASLRHELWVIAMFSAALLPLACVGMPRWRVPVATQSATIMIVPPTLKQTPPEAVRSHEVKQADHEIKPGLIPVNTEWRSGIGWVQALGFGWFLGFAAIFVRFVFGIAAVHKLAKNATDVSGNIWLPLLDRLRSELSIAGSVRVAIGTGTFPPMTRGWLILLPAEADRWTAERRHLVLAHELAHVKRRDGMMQAIVQVVCAVYWFNPLFWFSATCLRLERERACDDQVLNLGVEGHTYASHLLEVARMIRPPIYSSTTVSMAHPSQLETRLSAIMDGKRNRRTLSRCAASAAYCLASVLTLIIATVRFTSASVPLPMLSPPSALTPQQSNAIRQSAAPQAYRQSVPFFQEPALAAPKWIGTWKLSKERSRVGQDSKLVEMFNSIESLTIRFDGVRGGVTVTASIVIVPASDSSPTSRRTSMQNQFTAKFGDTINIKDIFSPFMEEEGTVTFRPVTDAGLEAMINYAGDVTANQTSLAGLLRTLETLNIYQKELSARRAPQDPELQGVQQQIRAVSAEIEKLPSNERSNSGSEILSWTVSDDGKTLTETAPSSLPGLWLVLEKQ